MIPPSYRMLHLARVPDSGFAKVLVMYLSRRFRLEPRFVLDLGCGSGGYTREWKARFPEAEVVGVDRDPAELLGVLTKKFEFGKDKPERSLYDVVFSKSVLEHLGPEAQAGFIEVLRSSLGSLGIAFVLVPDWKTGMDVFYDDYTHVRPFTQESLNDVLSVAGFDAQVEVLWQVPFAWEYPRLWSVVRRFWWLVRNPDLKNRFRHAALLAVVRRRP